MITKRIIPCLDIQNGRTVKGVQFKALKDAGDPVELARKYADEGADELVFLDITATEEKRQTLVTLVRNVAAAINIPFTVGGGVRTVADAELLLQNGADKVAVNSAALENPELIADLAKRFGSQCIVAAIDAKPIQDKWKVFRMGGKWETEWELLDWSRKVTENGAGEILFTAIDQDGRKNGFANEMLAILSQTVNVPIIASGGAGKITDFITVFKEGKADAALAASVFHYNEITIPLLKKALSNYNIPVRL
ncbi:imidazole glycerol phosphate synthase subunit HisF [Flavobacterium cerinum]|uniref:Imidazole glycerol phosphate synthase subunit HisF n=1 Tax=Flavobacterium cerinum TaxID=2502784 RepID=A0ABY5INW7_9FLAO|nr:imidazole glycerol phosphate synthase subunit HisF [Flavobacterium cerinum]UUC44536.1 imidazole glycerol phosphate synthase subunit HisF [Flavobacterium cerinum]